MTPTDALIEKMARAIARADESWTDQDYENCKTWPQFEHFRGLARAAYEAEHEEEGK